MILYVAGPMSGIKDFNYPAFDVADRLLAQLGHHVLNPVRVEGHNPTPGTPQAWSWYMRHALRMVTEADGMALLPGWEDSRGATLEHAVAVALGLDIRSFQDWLEDGVLREIPCV